MLQMSAMKNRADITSQNLQGIAEAVHRGKSGVY